MKRQLTRLPPDNGQRPSFRNRSDTPHLEFMSRFRQFWNRGWGYLWRRYTPFEAFLPEVDGVDLQLMREVRPFTMTSPERMYALLNAVRYVVANHLSGDITECGVWRGKNMILIAKALLQLKDTERHLY